MRRGVYDVSPTLSPLLQKLNEPNDAASDVVAFVVFSVVDDVIIYCRHVVLRWISHRHQSAAGRPGRMQSEAAPDTRYDIEATGYHRMPHPWDRNA
jgi:hypothetical protein